MQKIWLYILVSVGLSGALYTTETPASTPHSLHNTAMLQELSGKIVFQSNRSGNWDIYCMNVDGSNLVQLTHDPAEDGYPVWSPDGQRIAFESTRDGHYEIYLMNADGTEQQRVTNHSANSYNPAWSPDGQKIVFSSERNGKSELYTMNPDGNNVSRITDTLGENGIADWSPDGKRFALTAKRLIGWDVYVINQDGSGEQKLTDGFGACRPDWSPDGTKIAYVSQKGDGKGDIWIMEPDGSNQIRLTLDDVHYDYHPEWSPDGQHILYAKTPDKNTGNWDLYVISIDGQKEVRLTTHEAQDKFPKWVAGWVPDELFTRQEFIYEAETLFRSIGVMAFDSNASGGQAIYAEKGDERGFLAYGPYAPFPAAEYVAAFRLKIDRAHRKKSLGLLEITTDAGNSIIASQEITKKDFSKSNQYQEFFLPFRLETPKDLEFRVHFFDRADVWLDKVTITRHQ